MAVAIGLHPAVELGFLSFTSIDVDEFSIAGAMLGEPLEMVKCETIDVEVPAWAEIILECEIHPTEREREAPFGEYPGTYGPERMTCWAVNFDISNSFGAPATTARRPVKYSTVQLLPLTFDDTAMR